MKRRTALRINVGIGILLIVCGVGYLTLNVLQLQIDGFTIGLGAVMTAVGVLVLVLAVRGLRRYGRPAR
ncbi:MAG TPA: hypothetical protein VN759_02480 [Pseudolysinimonas sp.]|nr:hypothetical protein [Pseudolysinimonas sp.]